jgi:hypothetical protein
MINGEHYQLSSTKLFTQEYYRRTNMVKQKASITLNEDVMKAVKEAKGTIPFAVFVNDILWQLFCATDEQLENIDKYY